MSEENDSPESNSSKSGEGSIFTNVFPSFEGRKMNSSTSALSNTSDKASLGLMLTILTLFKLILFFR